KDRGRLGAQFKKVGVDFQATPVSAPTCSVAGDQVTSGDSARCFAQYMRIHALGGTNGLVYSQMGRYVAKPGTPFKYTDGIGGTGHRQEARGPARPPARHRPPPHQGPP